MTESITTAGQLLKELQLLESGMKASNATVGQALIKHFSFKGMIPWQIGVLRFEQLVDRACADLDILPENRRDKYKDTFVNKVRILVHPSKYNEASTTAIKAATSELVIERIENYDDSLNLAGRCLSLEEARVETTIQALSDLIAEMDADPSEIDEFIVPRLNELLVVLRRFSLFGSSGVEDYVAALIGATITKGMEVRGPLPDEVKRRIQKILGVSKAAMDGFVYLATGVQSIEWAGGHFGLIGGSS